MPRRTVHSRTRGRGKFGRPECRFEGVRRVRPATDKRDEGMLLDEKALHTAYKQVIFNTIWYQKTLVDTNINAPVSYTLSGRGRGGGTTMKVSFSVNGTEVSGDVEPRTLLG